MVHDSDLFKNWSLDSYCLYCHQLLNTEPLNTEEIPEVVYLPKYGVFARTMDDTEPCHYSCFVTNEGIED